MDPPLDRFIVRFKISLPTAPNGGQLDEANSLPRNILHGFSWIETDEFEETLEGTFTLSISKPDLISPERDAVEARIDNISFERQYDIVKAKHAEEQHLERLDALKELLQEESRNDWILESKLDTIALGVIDNKRTENIYLSKKIVMSSTCFVTVGSTRFDALTNEIVSNDTLTALKKLGVTALTVQIGAGEFEKKRFDEIFGPSCDHDTGSAIFAGLKINFYRYKPSIAEDLAKAKFVIGHAGAGTVIECLRLKQPLIVVVNELLMDNHQVELAAKLAELNHLLYCIPSELAQTLVDPRLFTLQPYVSPDMAKVARHINGLMGSRLSCRQVVMEEYTREPCPYRIGDDIGSAFSMGLVGGSIFRSFTGFRNAAQGQKMMGALREVRVGGPLMASQFAAWGGMFSTIDCCLVAIRKKEDPINSIVSGGATGALLAIRSGPKVMAGSAVLGAVILAMIEGVGLVASRWMGAMLDPTAPPPEALDDPRALGSTIKGNVQPGVSDSSTATPTAPFGLPGMNTL